jgi:hypothetical protein
VPLPKFQRIDSVQFLPSVDGGVSLNTVPPQLAKQGVRLYNIENWAREELQKDPSLLA